MCSSSEQFFFALQHFLPVLKGWHVLIRTDSTSAVYHINHQGGTRSKLGLRVSEQLLTRAFPHFLSLRAVHLPGVQNNVAAMVSSTAETTPGGAMAPPKETGPSLSAGGTHMASESRSPSALDLAIGSQEPLLASCDQSVIDTVLSSRAPSTRLPYANRWKLFSQWCQTQGELLENCSVATILRSPAVVIGRRQMCINPKGICSGHFSRACQSEQLDSGVTLFG